MPLRRTPATSRSARSPTWWPYVSLMSLKLSRSITRSDTSVFRRSARASSRVRCMNMQRVAVADRELLNDVRLDAGRETAPQRLVLLVVEKQRAAGERHDVAQLRRDERHRVGDAEAAAHRLCDLVERVDLAVRERDVLK